MASHHLARFIHETTREVVCQKKQRKNIAIILVKGFTKIKKDTGLMLCPFMLIDEFGLTIMERFLKEWIFTIKMAIKITMKLKT